MIRIVHLSDIHLNEAHIVDAEQFVIRALIKDLTSFNQKKEIDLIIFSGDLIDRAGASFQNDITLAFLTFEEKIIDPLSEALRLPMTRFFFVPGNHDIDTEADEKMEEIGLQHLLSSTNAVNDHIDSGNIQGIKRILPFKLFEETFFKDYQEDYHLTNYQSCFKASIGGVTVGIACFNSSWRCHNRPNEKNDIIIGERQVTNARQIIEGCDVKIAVVHHPLDWLKDFDQRSISSLISRDYDLLFCGHAHEGSTWTKSNMYGSLFVSLAPANWTYNLRDNDRIYANGYSIVDYDFTNMKLTTHSRRYSHSKECYDPNTDLGDEKGICVYNLPDSRELTKYHQESKVASTIKNTHFHAANEHLLSYNTDTKAPKELNSIFVLPRIVTKIEYDIEKEEQEQKYDIEALCSTAENILIFGAKESGKTVLLDRILVELTNTLQQHHKIPVSLDFAEVGYKRYETIISQFLCVGIKNINEFLSDHKVTLLIDNLSFSPSDKQQLTRLSLFLKQNRNVQVIATSAQLLEGKIPLDLLEYPTFSTFRTLTIKGFKTKEIKALIRLWFSGSETFDTPQKFDKLLDFFLTLNLPRTPLAISMFLWIIEQQENYKPINHATMLENFIERLFKKWSRKEIYADSFDYRNKERLLAGIAHHLYKANLPNYSLLYNDLRGFIREYLRVKKFDFDAGKVLEHFLSKGVLITETDDSETYVRFRFTCFFQYFLMKRMDYDPSFKEYVLNEDNYLFFDNEIDYYTGIKRDQSDILKLLVDRMRSEYADALDVISRFKYRFDDAFMTKASFVSSMDETFMDRLRQSEKPSEEELDRIKDEMLDKLRPEKGIQKKEDRIGPLRKMERLWVLSAKVLKNTEETEVIQLKDNSYESILHCSMAFTNMYKYYLEEYLERNRENLHPTFKENLVLQKRILPLLHQIVLYVFMGTSKLSLVIRDKLEKDMASAKMSDFEKFISVFLYSDIRGKDYLKYIKQFVKGINQSYIIDMTLLKILSYYYLRSKGKKSDSVYENLIGDLIVYSKKLKKIKKGKIIKNYSDRKKKGGEDFDSLLLE